MASGILSWTPWRWSASSAKCKFVVPQSLHPAVEIGSASEWSARWELAGRKTGEMMWPGEEGPCRRHWGYSEKAKAIEKQKERASHVICYRKWGWVHSKKKTLRSIHSRGEHPAINSLINYKKVKLWEGSSGQSEFSSQHPIKVTESSWWLWPWCSQRRKRREGPWGLLTSQHSLNCEFQVEWEMLFQITKSKNKQTSKNPDRLDQWTKIEDLEINRQTMAT